MRVKKCPAIYEEDLGKLLGHWPAVTAEMVEQGDSGEWAISLMLGTRVKREARKRAAFIIRVLRSSNAERGPTDRKSPAPDTSSRRSG